MAESRTYQHRLIIGFVKAISRLPLWLTYRISDVVFLILYWGVRYRRSVVRSNLERSFPALPQVALRRIERSFYRHFCDLFAEILRAFTMSDAELARRYVVENPEIIDRLVEAEKSIILLSHHYGNFEWMSTRMDLLFDRRIPTYGLYTPIKSSIAEELLHYMRSRRGIRMLPMTGAIKQVIHALKSGSCAFGFLTDQAPSRGQKLHFGPFLDQATASPTVVAKLILRTGAQLLYTDVRKLRRGYYSLKLMEVDASEYAGGGAEQEQAFTDAQLALLSQTIRRDPPFWLWSHRRWKHKPREGDSISPVFTTQDQKPYAP